jgi:hypothetical protein
VDGTVDARLLARFRRSRQVNALLQRAETNRRAAAGSITRVESPRRPIRALELRD